MMPIGARRWVRLVGAAVDEKLSWNITSRNLLSAYGQLLRTTFPAANAQALPPESSSRTAGV